MNQALAAADGVIQPTYPNPRADELRRSGVWESRESEG